MKQTIRLTEGELRRMIAESVMQTLDETQNDWRGLESDDMVEVNGQKVPRKFYKKYMKNKEKGESMDAFKARMKQEAANKRAETKAKKAEEEKAKNAKKADREEAKRRGMSYNDYMAEKDKNVDKAVAESVKRVLNEQEITTYQNPTQTWQGQNNYMAKLYQVLKLSQDLGLNEITNFVQQKIQQLYKAQSNNLQRNNFQR